MDKKQYFVDNWSLHSLRVELKSNGNVMGAATAFIVKYKNKYFLVTNRHVLSGKNTNTGEFIMPAVPEEIVIWHHASSEIVLDGYGAWTMRTENLLDENLKEIWFQHPSWKSCDIEIWWEKNIDIAVLPLSKIDDKISIYDVKLSEDDMTTTLHPAQPVSIIGYPFNEVGADWFPIWKTGHIASDVNAHNKNLYFYIDATTRSGMSGAPVVYRDIIANGKEINTSFLGIYSGRIRSDIEIGIVWRTWLIKEVLEFAYSNT